ncbi:MAG TPA: (Fe-S)-binding protein, partial [Gammaproteobacteria bacterium]|nr:(Fe-S)-binding protein [Gammaproteobacteria bacterium]
MCPYARFQSAMFDKDTMIVAYDKKRGEAVNGRAKLVKGRKTEQERHQQGYGDCVDCGFCVQVCPTGIDIRDGLQIECISCALCIDACDNIMDSLGWPRGLIRYDSERNQEGGKTRLLTVKNTGYAVSLLIATAALIWSIVTSSTLDVAVQQVRQPLYVMLSDGQIQNSYLLKLINKDKNPIKLSISIQGLDNAQLDIGHMRAINVEADQSLQIRLRVRMKADASQVQVAFKFIIDSASGDQHKIVPAFFSMPR